MFVVSGVGGATVGVELINKFFDTAGGLGEGEGFPLGSQEVPRTAGQEELREGNTGLHWTDARMNLCGHFGHFVCVYACVCVASIINCTHTTTTIFHPELNHRIDKLRPCAAYILQNQISHGMLTILTIKIMNIT
jgi:hypothetical protein